MMSEKYIDDVVHIQMSTPRIDSRNAHEFKHEIYKLIDSGQKNLLISLRSVEFIDSSGLGAIVSSLVSMGRRGEIVLCEPHDAVSDLFKLTRVNRLFRIFEEENEAWSYLSKKHNGVSSSAT